LPCDDLASQPTISRWENARDLRTLLRLGHAMIDLWCRGHRKPPKVRGHLRWLIRRIRRH
jgi:hypothetical protein